MLANNISINGIAYTKNDNVEGIIKVTADVLKIDNYKEDIQSAYCVKTKDNNNSKLVVQFTKGFMKS